LAALRHEVTERWGDLKTLDRAVANLRFELEELRREQRLLTPAMSLFHPMPLVDGIHFALRQFLWRTDRIESVAIHLHVLTAIHPAEGWRRGIVHVVLQPLRVRLES
jgi:hypothetical protein